MFYLYLGTIIYNDFKGGIMKNFKYDTIVEIVNTNSSLDGVTGKIKGIAQDFGDYKHYIVSCEKPIKDDFTSIAITEHCLINV